MTSPKTENGHDERPNAEERIPPGVGTMSVVRWGLVLVMGLIALLSIAYATGALAKVSFGGTHAAQKSLYYCPMHPSVVQDHPGECPICSMTLVPKPEGGSDKKMKPATTRAGSQAPAAEAKPVPGLADLELPADRIQLIGMRTAKVERAALGDSLRAVGVIAANERGLSEISVRFSGWVQQLMVSETGQRVRRGEVLANVYSPEVLRAEQEYLTARGWDTKAGATGDSVAVGHHGDSSLGASMQGGLAADARHRLELLGIAATEIEAMASRGKASDSVPIRSPSDGYVTARNVVPGAAIQAGAPLFEVADLSKVWFLADVFEQDAARIRIGQKAVLELAAYANEHFNGRVQFISPTLNTATRTLRVRLEFANKTGAGGVKLRPGMYGTVALELPSASGLVIPSEALVDTGENQYVFVAKAEGHFEPRLVQVGARAGEKVQVASGVAEGETVVTTGNFLLDSESRLRAAIDGERAAPAAASGGGAGEGPNCANDFDATRFPDKARACRACERQHRGMGSMEQDCKAAIEKPWK
ncbi:MAG TPA: efflux RND transporter periplasmic adaptor subunit [Polyangia bacterium]|jgi:Cu(I)/Ag(I) efflux system membrane fusion protein|nr:efflux RND transporter periplasmic adaptor subunit [Polyangia bacterium]